MKEKGQRDNRGPIETMAHLSLGVWDGSRLSLSGAPSGRFDSPQVQPDLKFLPASCGSRARGNVLGYEPKTGLETRCHSRPNTPRKARAKVTYHNCNTQRSKFGRDRKGHQRFRCRTFTRTFTLSHNGHLPGMYARTEKAASRHFGDGVRNFRRTWTMEEPKHGND
jgi:hypothetical protein